MILGETCGFTGAYLDDSLNLEVLSTVSGLILHYMHRLDTSWVVVSDIFFKRFTPSSGTHTYFFMVAPLVTSWPSKTWRPPVQVELRDSHWGKTAEDFKGGENTGGYFHHCSRWWFQISLFSPGSLGKISNLKSISFNWVGSTSEARNWVLPHFYHLHI